MLCWPNLFALVGGFGPRECADRAHRWDAARVTFDPGWDPIAHQDQVLGPLVRVIEEAASDAPWALIGATAIRLQGVEAGHRAVPERVLGAHGARQAPAHVGVPRRPDGDAGRAFPGASRFSGV